MADRFEMARFDLDRFMALDEPMVVVYVEDSVQVTVTVCAGTGTVTVVAHDVERDQREEMSLSLSDTVSYR
jgi:hypothetical protein